LSRKIISISEAHYSALKQRGRFRDSFDDVVGDLLQDSKKVKRALLADSRVGRSYNQPRAIITTKESGGRFRV